MKAFSKRNLKRGVVFVGAALAVATISAVASFSLASEALASGAKSAPTPPPALSKKSTDLSFDEVLVQGKYHFSDEAVTTVEEDKTLDGLLGVRQDFKDRIKQSASRH